MKDYEKVYDEFWKSIIQPNGTDVDIDAMKRELYDFHTLLEEVPKVYCELTHGRISKPNTLASEVIREAREANEELDKSIIYDDISMLAEDAKNIPEFLLMIEEYLEQVGVPKPGEKSPVPDHITSKEDKV